jgi:hypothetical protein
MQITRSTEVSTQKGPDDGFTGDVHVDAVAAPATTSTFAAGTSSGIGMTPVGPAATKPPRGRSH